MTIVNHSPVLTHWEINRSLALPSELNMIDDGNSWTMWKKARRQGIRRTILFSPPTYGIKLIRQIKNWGQLVLIFVTLTYWDLNTIRDRSRGMAHWLISHIMVSPLLHKNPFKIC